MALQYLSVRQLSLQSDGFTANESNRRLAKAVVRGVNKNPLIMIFIIFENSN